MRGRGMAAFLYRYRANPAGALNGGTLCFANYFIVLRQKNVGEENKIGSGMSLFFSPTFFCLVVFFPHRNMKTILVVSSAIDQPNRRSYIITQSSLFRSPSPIEFVPQ